MKHIFQLPFSIFVNLILLFFDNISNKNKNINNNINENNKLINLYKISNKYNGYDNRYITENNLSNIQLNNYRRIYNNYKLLKNEDISINTKLKLIKKENIFGDNIVPNITKGGLYKNWDF